MASTANRLIRFVGLFAIASSVAVALFVGGVFHGSARSALAACQPSSFTAFAEKSVYYLDTFYNHMYPVTFDDWYGRCSSNGTEYIQFATETTADQLSIAPTSMVTDQTLYLCPNSGCQNVFQGQGVSNQNTGYSLYEDSTILVDTFAGQKWCIYHTYHTSTSYIDSIWYDPNPVTVGSWEACGTF